MNEQDKKNYLQPAFIICVAVLFSAAAGMSAITNYLGIKTIKKPIYLQKPFDELNEQKLGAYKVVNKQKITNKDVLEALGTRDYIQWFLEDQSVAENSPVRFCTLFITYYTGNPDQVPHVPDECYTGAGKQTLALPTELVFNVPLKGKTEQIPTRLLLFGEKTGFATESPEPVIYFFKVNGQFKGNRDTARAVLQTNFRSKYSYFSKVEWKFFNRAGTSTVFPNVAELTAASQKFLTALVPVLENDHWPDWQAANSKK